MCRPRFFFFGILAALAACGGDEADGPSTVTVGSTVQPDGESGDLVITLHRAGSGTRAISIPYTTHADSAQEDTDFVPASSTVEWAEGDTSDKTIVIPFVDDLIVEDSEAFTVELGEATNGVEFEATTMTVTITDDDGPGDSVAVTSAGRLVHFNRDEPRLRWSVELSGLGSGESIRGLDYRPKDGTLYALTDAGKLYTLDPMSGAATPGAALVAAPGDTSSPFTALPADPIGMDFNPVTDELRVTSTAGHNLRIAVDEGHVTTDTAISGPAAGYSALAHNHNIAAACRTTLYAIDVATNRFLSQSTRDDGVTIGQGGLGLDATATGGFDVYTDSMGMHQGLAVLTVAGQSGFYGIELGSGRANVLRANVGPLDEGETIVAFAMPSLPPDAPVTQQRGELFGVTATQVISFNRAATAKFCTSATINGLETGETVVGLDMRPSSGVLYILTKTGTAGALRRLDPIGGNTSPAIPIPVPLQGTAFGVDFDPTGPVALRIVSNTGQNLRVTDLDGGATTSDSPLTGAGTAATGAAYTDAVPGAGTTALYVIDAATDRLRRQSPPNSGTLVDVGPLGVDITDVAGFDIDGRDNTAFVVVTVNNRSELRTLDLATGALSAPIGTIAGDPLRGATRATPETNVYGITTENKLVRISVADPSMVTVVSDPMLMPPVDTITNLDNGEYLVGIDVRPVSNVIYGLGNLGNIYTVNSGIARANKQGLLSADPMDTSSPFSALAGSGFGIDFDPTAISLRVVSDVEQNLRIPDVTMPRVFTDSAFSSPGAMDATAAAYTNSYPPRPGQTVTTTLYVIDVAAGRLLVQSSPGTLTSVGPLAASGSFATPGMPSLDGFDIAGGNNGVVLAAFQRPSSAGTPEPFSRLYRIDLATGAATEIGVIGGAPVRGLAIQIR